LDGLGFEELLVETVGVGQSEVEIATTADTTIVVVSPGWGDAVQASKAGFLEIADIFVVNKADRPDTDATVRDLEAMLALGAPMPWSPPVLTSIATDSVGVEAIVEAVHRHREHLVATGELGLRRERKAARELAAAIRQGVEASSRDRNATAELVARIAAHEIDPWTAAESLLAAR
jgi:LAO/AO transport system kinase